MNFSFLSHLCEGFTLFVIFPAVLLIGIYLTLRLRCLQVTGLKEGFLALVRKEKGAEGSITNYQAIASVLAGNFGTGNISGMAVALATGGPGALVWMWVMAFFGSVIQYASCYLGLKYRTQNKDKEYVGGPMYYLKEGAGFKGLAVVFALLVIVAAFAVGSFVQVNSIALPLCKAGLSPVALGLAMAVLVGIVILGGIGRVAKVAASVVPLMALIYLGTAITIIFSHREHLPQAFTLLIQSAFGKGAFFGGVAGYSLARAVTTGFDRSLFATDAGTGSVPILQASATTRHPVSGGIVSVVAPFLVMVVCSATALVLILTNSWYLPGLQSTNLVTLAFSRGIGSKLGAFIVTTSLVLFAYTTILAWASCGARAAEFLLKKKGVRLFQWAYILVIPLGALLRVDIVWLLADFALVSMLLINLIGITALHKEIICDTKEFLLSKNRVPSLD